MPTTSGKHNSYANLDVRIGVWYANHILQAVFVFGVPWQSPSIRCVRLFCIHEANTPCHTLNRLLDKRLHTWIIRGLCSLLLDIGIYIYDYTTPAGTCEHSTNDDAVNTGCRNEKRRFHTPRFCGSDTHRTETADRLACVFALHSHRSPKNKITEKREVSIIGPLSNDRNWLACECV